MASIPDSCPLKDEFVNARIWKNEFASALDEMIGLLSSYLEWQGSGQAMPRISGKQYDLFLSHANKDKIAYVDALYASLSKLGIPIFYDKEVLQWGDKWKERILEGVAKSEFAIIVVSDNFFGREWTERSSPNFCTDRIMKDRNSSYRFYIIFRQRRWPNIIQHCRISNILRAQNTILMRLRCSLPVSSFRD